MELKTLQKKLSTYLTSGGYLKNVPEDLLGELLHTWEEWAGSTKEFYSEVGFSQKKMASLIGKAKKLKREGYFGVESFKEVKVPEDATEASGTEISKSCSYIEYQSEKGQIIRFPRISQLMEFLEKAG